METFTAEVQTLLNEMEDMCRNHEILKKHHATVEVSLAYRDPEAGNDVPWRCTLFIEISPSRWADGVYARFLGCDEWVSLRDRTDALGIRALVRVGLFYESQPCEMCGYEADF